MQRKPNQEALTAKIIGHVNITDDLGNTLLDEDNAVHPQNLARVFARALANEPNSQIYRVALGNGGTTISAGNTITYKTPNDGQLPDPSGWQSRLYNETYSEVIDDASIYLGSGNGTEPTNDPTGANAAGVRSIEQGLISLVTIDVTLNSDEPVSQDLSDNGDPILHSEFMFDELGLFTPGAPPTNTSGFQTINLDNKNIYANTGLAPSYQYVFGISVNGGGKQLVTITTPSQGTGISGTSHYITYEDLMPLLNSVLNGYGVNAVITDQANLVDAQGNLILFSTATGPNSSVVIDQTTTTAPNFLFNHLLGFESISSPQSGKLAGVQNNSIDPTVERERLLTHIVFSPILKSANRTIRIVYTLTVAVGRTQEPPIV